MLQEQRPDTAGPGGADALLVRALGVRELSAAIFNYTVGGGIFVLPAVAAAEIGAAAPLAYLLCALVMGLILLCFAEAGSRVSLTGGPYAYVEAALGPFVGFLAGVLLWVTILSAAAAVTGAFAGTVLAFAGRADDPALRSLLIVALLVLLAGVNLQGVKTGARLIEAATLAKLLPLVAFVAAGAFFVRPESLAWEAAPRAGDVARTAVVLIFAFAGVESALTPSGEVRDPSRTVPRSVFIGLGGVTLLYFAIQVVAQGVLSSDLASQRDAPLAAAAARIAGGPGRWALIVGAAVSMFGFVSGATLAGPRILFAFARDGFLPARLAAVHERSRAPHAAIVVHIVLTGVLAISGGFARLAVLANVSALTLYLFCAVSAWELRRRDVRAGGTPFRVPGGPAVPALACGAILWLLSKATRQEFAAAGIALAIGVVLYLLRFRKPTRLRALRSGP